jgi:UrcA family protein
MNTMTTMTTASRFQSLIGIALFSILSSGLPALPAAADSVAPLQVTVKLGDLDISKPQGAAVLYGRIRSAAEKVCFPFKSRDLRDLSAKMHLDACIQKVVVNAVTAVNEPTLLAVYSAKTGKTLPVRVASLQNP